MIREAVMGAEDFQVRNDTLSKKREQRSSSPFS